MYGFLLRASEKLETLEILFVALMLLYCKQEQCATSINKMTSYLKATIQPSCVVVCDPVSYFPSLSFSFTVFVNRLMVWSTGNDGKKRATIAAKKHSSLSKDKSFWKQKHLPFISLSFALRCTHELPFPKIEYLFWILRCNSND